MKNPQFYIRRAKFYALKTIRFFTVTIWVVSAQTGRSVLKKIGYQVIRILTVAVEKFIEHRCSVSASDLTYYTLFAIVPFLAIAYGVAILLGMETALIESIDSALSGQGALGEKLILFAQRTIVGAKGGLITVVALAFFLWSIFSMLSNIETTVNRIWEVEKNRNFIRRMRDYFLVIVLGPILLVAGSAANIFISSNIIETISEEVLHESLSFLTSYLVPIGVFSVLFFMIYQGMPNREIKARSSFWAALITGTAFQILQYYYFNIQIYISSYNSIYGSFAALPLLLVWLRMSWMLILFGAELAFGIEKERGFGDSQKAT